MLHAFLIGLKDGLESPHYLSVGMSYYDENGSYDDQKNTIYDHGANVGQFFGCIVARLRNAST